MLDRADLLGLIDAREVEAEPAIQTLPAWREYLLGSAGGLMVAAGRLLGVAEPELQRPIGAAYGAAGLLRSVAAHARQGRCLLPCDVLAEHGLIPEQVIAEPAVARGVVGVLAGEGLALLRPQRLPRHAIAAVLPAVLARRDLRRAPVFPTQRGLGDRLAVVLGGLAGRV